MASALRTTAPLRAASSFSATAPKLPSAAAASVRNLHITGAREASPALTSFERSLSAVPPRSKSSKPTPSRDFNTSLPHKAPHDSSPVDLAYMPSLLSTSPSTNPSYQTYIQPIPLLPDNFAAKPPPAFVGAPEPAVARPEISTTSLGGSVSAFGEAEAGKAADMIGLVGTEEEGSGGRTEREKGGWRRVVGDMVEDLVGGGRKGEGVVA